MWNRLEHRPLEGHVLALTPFNFSSIAANLPAAPALMGNTTIWKPSETSVLSNWYLVELLQEAGVPAGVINFVPGPAPEIAGQVIKDSRFAGVHFTGSTRVFNGIWKIIGNNMDSYKTYPRVVGETGGKDFIMADEKHILCLPHAPLRADLLDSGASPTGNGGRTNWNDGHGFSVDVKLFCPLESKEIEFTRFDCFEHWSLA